MKILLAPNAFKESLSAVQFCDAFAESFLASFPDAEIEKVPLADGGDGTLEVLVRLWNGAVKSFPTEDPLRRAISAPVGFDPSGSKAVIEMALTSGLALLNPKERNPYHTSTYGLGQLLAQVAREGVREILLCIGGSATVDGGMGMAEALGFRHVDREGKPVPSSGGFLREIDRILPPDANPLAGIQLSVLSDVENPLTGPTGAAVVFGPQKGANPDQIKALDDGLQHLADLWGRDLGKSVSSQPGAGAAGGVGGAAMAYLDAQLVHGGPWFLEQFGLDKKVRECDLVITGEGSLDSTTLDGKLPTRVAALAKQHGKPCVGICGRFEPSALPALTAAGFTRILPLAPDGTPKEESIRMAEQFLRELADQMAREYKTGVPPSESTE